MVTKKIHGISFIWSNVQNCHNVPDVTLMMMNVLLSWGLISPGMTRQLRVRGIKTRVVHVCMYTTDIKCILHPLTRVSCDIQTYRHNTEINQKTKHLKMFQPATLTCCLSLFLLYQTINGLKIFGYSLPWNVWFSLQIIIRLMSGNNIFQWWV